MSAIGFRSFFGGETTSFFGGGEFCLEVNNVFPDIYEFPDGDMVKKEAIPCNRGEWKDDHNFELGSAEFDLQETDFM